MSEELFCWQLYQLNCPLSCPVLLRSWRVCEVNMEELRAVLLILSQLFFTLVGSIANVLLGITLRDLPKLTCSTYYVLLANVTICNLLVCAFVKTILSIYIAYAYLKVNIL